jgi:putative methyltransferase (TIGR04325 family)
MRRDDPIAHNTVLSFAHALTTAAGGRPSLTVLDWGGALGHFFELARRLTPLELEWYVRELPAVCAVGVELEPDVAFHDSDACLERSYDLVLANNSIQYARDWRSQLARLASSAAPWLLLNRVPAVETVPTYTALQRAEELGFELVREYALVARSPSPARPRTPSTSACCCERPARSNQPSRSAENGLTSSSSSSEPALGRSSRR